MKAISNSALHIYIFPMLTRKLRSAWNYLFQGEFFAFFQSLLTFFFPKFLFNAEKMYLYRLSPSSETVEPKENVGCGTEVEVREIVESFDGGDETVAELYRTFLQRKAEPWCLKEKDRILGVVWFFRERYTIPWEGYEAYVFEIDLEPNEAFVANVFVDPAARGRGLFAEIVRGFLAKNPGTILYSSVSASNPVSLRAHEKIGFRRFGAIVMLRMLKLAVGRFFLKSFRGRWFRLRRGTKTAISLHD